MLTEILGRVRKLNLKNKETKRGTFNIGQVILGWATAQISKQQKIPFLSFITRPPTYELRAAYVAWAEGCSRKSAAEAQKRGGNVANEWLLQISKQNATLHCN